MLVFIGSRVKISMTQILLACKKVPSHNLNYILQAIRKAEHILQVKKQKLELDCVTIEESHKKFKA